ncbi:Acetyl-coenzyme A synthetase [Pantoea sp. AS-PWVM4]|uniref:AMP-binding protein n=1 Tax=Pantoea sp. AS-PWVM4 TaxID=1332069 RepID=UPI0003AC8110|nr:AMP-binding protein [Pantoea sp. AS-PWVM4]ERK05816.1 Acetyl-coenzyme A synthetase [Pantoea sp. AS-PWVM4]
MSTITVNDAAFWQQEAQRLDWQQDFTSVVEEIDGGPRCRWFPGGRTNLSYNALDRHLAEKGDRCAIIQRDYRGATQRLSYRELWQQVNALSHLMISWGIRQGDRVMIVLPMTPLAAVAMLACARLGAVHVVVYSGVTSDALAQRVVACQPALLLHCSEPRGRQELPSIPTASATLRAVDCYSPDFTQALAQHIGCVVPCVWLETSQPSHLLFTSGTTGAPKGIVRDTGGYAVALLASLRHLFHVQDDEIFFTTADVGWVTGHSYGIYAPLLAGITTVMYEASTVNTPGESWWQMVAELGITRMLTIAGAIRLARQQGKPHASLASLRSLYLAGEPLDPATHGWVTRGMGVTCENHYWQTESGWPLLAGTGSGLAPVFTRAVDIVDATSGESCAPGQAGMLVIKDTLGPGGMSTLWQDDTQHDQRYWLRRDGRWFYATHDCAVRQNDSIVIQGRMDDVINIGGKRLATAEVENALAGIAGIIEVVATRTPHHLLGEMVALFVVTEGLTVQQEGMLKQQIRERLVSRCGRFALPRKIHFRRSLPKTFSGKFLRRMLTA